MIIDLPSITSFASVVFVRLTLIVIVLFTSASVTSSIVINVGILITLYAVIASAPLVTSST